MDETNPFAVGVLVARWRSMDPARRLLARLWRALPGDHLTKGYGLAFGATWLVVSTIGALNGVEEPGLTGVAVAALAMLPVSSLHLGLPPDPTTGLRGRLAGLARRLDLPPVADEALAAAAEGVVTADDPGRRWIEAELELGLVTPRRLRAELDDGTVPLAPWVRSALERVGSPDDRAALLTVWDRELSRRLRRRDAEVLAVLGELDATDAARLLEPRGLLGSRSRDPHLLAALRDDAAMAAFVVGQDVEATDPSTVAADLEQQASRLGRRER
ncbi:MAG: hypothetical protein AB1Z55_06555 [Acidimicrobiia bacterium]